MACARLRAVAAYAARGMEMPVSMGLRPRLSADAAFAAYWNPGLAPGGSNILSRGNMDRQDKQEEKLLPAKLTRSNTNEQDYRTTDS